MSNFYQVEIFNDQFDFVSATSVDISQNIELDYLTFNSYKITTLPIEVEKGCFIHITQENELVADGMVADVQPEDGLITITIRPLQSLFDIDVYYSAVSDCITWIATNIGSQLATNADALQNRPIDITYTTASENLPLTGYNFNATVNILSVIGNALKTYGVVCDTYLDLVNKRIKCNIYANADTKTLEADLDNVLGKEVTIGDSYGAANKLTIQKIEAQDGEKTVLGEVTYYLHSDGTISDVNSDRITPVFYKLEQIELDSEETAAEWTAKAYAKAVEVLSPQKYDNEIVLSYHRDDKIATPMELTIGTATTIYVDGIAYSSILTGRAINGNVVTLTFGAVRTELTKKLILQKGNTGTIQQIMNQVQPQLTELYSLIGGGEEYLPISGGNITGSLTVQNSAVVTESSLSAALDGETADNMNLKSPSLVFGLNTNSDPSAYPRVTLRSAGSAAQGTLDLSLVYEANSSSQQFFSLLNENGEFLESLLKIKSIQRISVSNSTSVAAGANATLTGTLNTSSGATNWFFVPVYVNYGYVRANITRSGTTVSVPVYNASGAAHTMSGNVLCIGY